MASPVQGEVWWVNLNPTRGSEQQGQRPALVVSRDEMHVSGRYMIVPGTSKTRRQPGRVLVPKGVAGLELDTDFLCTQLRTVDGIRFMRRLGSIDRKYIQQVHTQIRFFISLPDIPR